MIVNILKNYSHMYFIHYIIIKFISFELVYYNINSGNVSPSIIFSDFHLCLSILLDSINKIPFSFFQKKWYN